MGFLTSLWHRWQGSHSSREGTAFRTLSRRSWVWGLVFFLTVSASLGAGWVWSERRQRAAARVTSRDEICASASQLQGIVAETWGRREPGRQPPGRDVARLVGVLEQQNERLWGGVRDRVLETSFASWHSQAQHLQDGELLQALASADRALPQDRLSTLAGSFFCRGRGLRVITSSSVLEREWGQLRSAAQAYLQRERSIEKLAIGFSQDLESVCIARNSERLFQEQEGVAYAPGIDAGTWDLRDHVRAGIEGERRTIESSFQKRWAKWAKLEDLVRCPRARVAPLANGAPRKLASAPVGSPHPKLEVLSQSQPLDAYPKMILSGRRSRSSPRGVHSDPHDRRDASIRSPKSARFSSRGDLLYIQALEGEETAVLTANGLRKLTGILHRFDSSSRYLFQGARLRAPASIREPFEFSGKPVESELTHEGRYLWVPYYRKSYDPYGRLPSALAIIDTQSHRIVRVIETGSIAKGVRASRDGRWVAISNWGENTVSLWNIQSESPSEFSEVATLSVGPSVALEKVGGNRDHQCGVCVRGLSFSADSRYLWVGAMHTGEIATFDLSGFAGRASPGRVSPIQKLSRVVPHPRDLVVSPDGRWLFVSCAATGKVYRISTALLTPGGKPPEGAVRSIAVAGGVRSIRLSTDGAWIFAAVHGASEIAVLDVAALELRKVASIATDPYPVGLDLSPDGRWLAVTAQGVHGRGGDATTIFWVLYPPGNVHLRMAGGIERALSEFAVAGESH